MSHPSILKAEDHKGPFHRNAVNHLSAFSQHSPNLRKCLPQLLGLEVFENTNQQHRVEKAVLIWHLKDEPLISLVSMPLRLNASATSCGWGVEVKAVDFFVKLMQIKKRQP